MSKNHTTVTVAEMRSIEMNAEYLGVSPLQLMENAGNAVTSAIISHTSPGSDVMVYCGPGRNGGDGMVAARLLASQGCAISLCLVAKQTDLTDEVVLANWHALRNMTRSVDMKVLHDSSQIAPTDCGVIVDALLGIGARGELRSPISEAVSAINQSRGFKVAVDVPTGVDSDTGEVHDVAVEADLTVTFHRPKRGLLKAKRYVGELVVSPVGIPLEAELYAGPGDVMKVIRHRPLEAHKGDFGRLLVVGGSHMYSGAPAYVALAALRTGVDLVYVAAPERAANTVASLSPNLITVMLEGRHLKERHLETLESLLDRATAVAVGPGLGTDEETFRAVDMLLEIVGKRKTPTLLDADALRSLGRCKRRMEMPSVLTPHLGEFQAMSGVSPPSELDSKMKIVRQVAEEMNSTILLKGNTDVISDGARVRLNRTGNPGMTVGGTGDVLSGIVSAFLSQGFDPFDAACGGAFINGAAGDLVYRDRGYHIVATDLIDYISTVMMNPMLHREILRSRGAGDTLVR